MPWYQIVGNFGVYLHLYVAVILLGILVGFVTVRWQCGICGKVNETGLIKSLLCMCDHTGMF